MAKVEGATVMIEGKCPIFGKIDHCEVAGVSVVCPVPPVPPAPGTEVCIVWVDDNREVKRECVGIHAVTELS